MVISQRKHSNPQANMTFNIFKRCRRLRPFMKLIQLVLIIMVGCFVFRTFGKQDMRSDSQPSQLSHYPLETKPMIVITTDQPIVIGAVTCDEPLKSVSSTLASVLIKSVLISAERYNVPRVEFHLFLEDMGKQEFFESKLTEYGYLNGTKGMVEFKMHFHSVFDVVPKKYHQKLIYVKTRRCAFVRLFLSSFLTNVGEILYLDTDNIVTGSIAKVWDLFGEMTGKKLIGAAQNTEQGPDANVFHINFADVPHVPPKGLNSGVLLMNLTKMRMYQWDTKILEAYNKYSLTYKFSRDQAFLNIFLHFERELLQQFPCNFNYNHIHCEYQKCLSAEKDPDGIQILHGAGKQFTSTIKHPLYPVYAAYKNFNFANGNTLNSLVLQLRKRFDMSRKCHVKLNRLLFKSMGNN